MNRTIKTKISIISKQQRSKRLQDLERAINKAYLSNDKPLEKMYRSHLKYLKIELKRSVAK